MKPTGTIEMEPHATPTGNQVHFPVGIPGFDHIKKYLLLVNPAEKPFAWLRVTDDSPLAFVVVDPFVVLPDYAPDIPEADVKFLDLKEANDALLLNIVTLHGPNRATVNLKGPIVINRHTHTGKQVIIANANNYSVEHDLPVAAATA
jgi:flagellar assembly factor FliW